MKLLKAVVLVFLAVLSIPVFSQDEPPVNIGEEYDVVQLKTRFGDRSSGFDAKMERLIAITNGTPYAKSVP